MKLKGLFFLILIIIVAVIFISNVKHSPTPNVTSAISSFSKKTDSIFKPVLLSTILSNLHFYFHDSISYGHPVNLQNPNNQLFLNAPTLLFEATDEQIPYLIYPGEHISIKNGENHQLHLTIEGNIERTNELQFFRKLINRTGILYDYIRKVKIVFALSQIEEVEKKIEQKKNIRLSFLDSAVKNNLISTEFAEIANSVIISASISDLLILYRDNIGLLTKNNLYNSEINRCIVMLNKLKYFPYFPYSRACMLSVNFNFKKTQDFVIADSVDFKKTYDFVATHYEKMAKNFLLSRCIFYALNERITIPSDYLQKYQSECTDSSFKNIIKNKLSEMEIIKGSKNRNMMLSYKGNQIDFSTLFSSFKDSLVLLDFWASWCAPCRSEMESSRTLKNLYQKQPVAFIYISTDKSTEFWKKACLEENLTGDKSFKIIDSDNAPFLIKNKIKTIPRYMLIDKNGKLISADAPWPSDPKLKILIDKNLKD